MSSYRAWQAFVFFVRFWSGIFVLTHLNHTTGANLRTAHTAIQPNATENSPVFGSNSHFPRQYIPLEPQYVRLGAFRSDFRSCPRLELGPASSRGLVSAPVHPGASTT